MTAEAMHVDTNGVADINSAGADETRANMDPAFSNFMKAFWDLASVDSPVRTSAGATIVRHVATSGGDAEYAVKRLIRGICSSRAAARQGFASCLAEILKVLPRDAPTTPAILTQILETTKMTTALKGMEERESAFGRILGLAALARSGRLESESACSESALQAMTELYNKRKWLGQVTCEIILLLLSTGFRDTDDFINVAIPLLVPLFKAKDGNFLKLSDFSPDQLMLSLGLRSILRTRGLDPQENASLKKTLPSFLHHASVVRLGKTQGLIHPLKQSAAVFPKVHTVWKVLWDDIGLAPAGQPRSSLTPKRLQRLGEVWSSVVEGALTTTTSLNNKGTALVILKQLLHRVPAAGVSHVISPGIIRILVNHSQSEDNYLFSLTRMILEQLPTIVEDDQEVQAQVAACLLQRGTIRFDQRVGFPAVASLVNGMGQDAIDAHMEFLKDVLRGKSGWAEQDTSGNGMAKGSSEGNKSAQKSTEEVKTSGDSSVNANAINAERLQAIGALHLLACRTSADDSVVEGNEHKNHNARMSQSSGGNLSRKQGERLRQTAVFFLEMGFLEPTDEGISLTENALRLCRAKFFSLVADIAAKPLHWVGEKHPDGTGWGALEALWDFHGAWQGFEAEGRKPIKGLHVGSDEREAYTAALSVVRTIREDGRMDKLKSAFAGILLVVTLHLLDGWEQDGRSEERCRHVLDIVETYGRMCGGKSGDDDVMEDGDEEGDDTDPLAMMADVLVAVMAESSNHSVKGLRDISRRVWRMVCSSRPMSSQALDTLLAVVCGDDNAPSPGEDEDGDDDDDDDDDDSDGDGDGEGMELRGKGKGVRTSREEDGSDEDEEEDDDEVKIDASDVERLLAGHDGQEDDSDPDDDISEGLKHHAGADAALAALINLKKSSRKKNIQEAQRQAYQIRLRALDLLEVLCTRHLDSPCLLSAMLPVVKTIKKLVNKDGPGSRSGGEASALRSRLQGLYKNQLLKCKPRQLTATLEGPGQDKASGDWPTRTAQIFAELLELFRSWGKDRGLVRLASLALEGGLSCFRSLKVHRGKGGRSQTADSPGVGETFEEVVEILRSVVGAFFEQRRGSGLNPRQVGEVVKEFSVEMAPVLLKAATGGAASDFLRVEAFHLWGGMLQRCEQLDSVARKDIVADCPHILEALGSMFEKTAVEAKAAGEANKATGDSEAKKEADSDQKLSGDGVEKHKKKGPATTRATLEMLRAKRLRPLLNCLSITVTAIKKDGKPRSPALQATAQALRAALASIEGINSVITIQRQCAEVAKDLKVIEGRAKVQVTDDVAVSRISGSQVSPAKDDDQDSGAKQKKVRKTKGKSPGSSRKKRKAMNAQGEGEKSVNDDANSEEVEKVQSKDEEMVINNGGGVSKENKESDSQTGNPKKHRRDGEDGESNGMGEEQQDSSKATPAKSRISEAKKAKGAHTIGGKTRKSAKAKRRKSLGT